MVTQLQQRKLYLDPDYSGPNIFPCVRNLACATQLTSLVLSACCPIFFSRQQACLSTKRQCVLMEASFGGTSATSAEDRNLNDCAAGFRSHSGV